ncbi:MAG: amino-acid N-acetyltransferase [Verrucomicrobia bacterium]|nr:amino-acid N-acetyltransferase [Verrucomicrobiota bacterium]MBV9657835.1 amino-acid N-acetyltransferase [Verrucomicrobiota bacterium]
MHVSDLRGILQYIPRFRDRTFVIAIDGEIVASENFSNLLLDLAVLRSLSIKVVIVHGARHQVVERAAELGKKVSNADGAGITDEATLKISLDAATRLTHEIMEGLTSVDLRAAYANVVIAYPAGILGGVDQQFTGKVERVDTQALELFLSQGIVPIIPPLGFDGEGKTYRVNSDSIAVEVAEAVRAAKIIFLCETGTLKVDGEIVRQLSGSEVEELLKKGKLNENKGQTLKIEAAARACRQGVPRVHLLDGHVNEALLAELFSNEGVGTMIHSNEYQHVRPARRTDVRRIMALIRQSVQNEELVRRTRADILDRIGDYYVLELDRNIVGCVALHAIEKANAGELACLYVNKSHANSGYGRKLVAFVEEQARERGYDQLFALSTQAFVFFQQKGGFTEATPEALPPGRREKYDASGRHSKVLVKPILPLPPKAALLAVE